MAGHKDFNELKAKMSPARREKNTRAVREMVAEMLLIELRKISGLTQGQLAEAIGIKQPTLSRLESQDDIQVSTLNRLIKALGGEMEIIVNLPQGRFKLTQFSSN